jgi:hypothetical protein
LANEPEPQPKAARPRKFMGWTPGTVTMVVAVIGTAATLATGLSASWIAKVNKDREIEIERAKLELEKQRDARKVENEYFQKATDPGLSPEQRQRVFRFLQIALRGKPLEKWATSELELARDEIKVAQEQQRKLAELQEQLQDARAKSGSQYGRIRALEDEVNRLSAKPGSGCRSDCAYRNIICRVAALSEQAVRVCENSEAACYAECQVLERLLGAQAPSATPSR